MRAADKAKSGQTGEKHTLTINKASEAETGLYQLVLTNKLGTTSIDAFIEVGPESELRAPRFKEPLANINVEINSTGTFQTVLTAEPIPEVVWYVFGILFLFFFFIKRKFSNDLKMF